MKTEVRRYSSYADVEYAAQVLKQGGLVVFPTETVYGLGALMSCPEAVHRIYEIKGRAENKPLSILVAEAERIGELARLKKEFPTGDTLSEEAVHLLAETFWPGPLTLVLPKTERVPDSVTAGQPTVGIRIPNHPFALALVKAVGEPVVTTSANLSGQASAISAQEANLALNGKIELLIDGGICAEKQASTVAGVSEGRIVIFREGRITEADLAAVIGGGQ